MDELRKYSFITSFVCLLLFTILSFAVTTTPNISIADISTSFSPSIIFTAASMSFIIVFLCFAALIVILTIFRKVKLTDIYALMSSYIVALAALALIFIRAFAMIKIPGNTFALSPLLYTVSFLALIMGFFLAFKYADGKGMPIKHAFTSVVIEFIIISAPILILIPNTKS